MLHFSDFSNVGAIFSEHNVSKIIIPIAADTLSDCNLYKSMSQKYSDLDAKFQAVVKDKTYKPGDYIKISLDSGHTIFFIVVRLIEKFQPYINDILLGLDRCMVVIRRELGDNVGKNSVVFILPTGDEIKLSDAIFIPAISDQLNFSDIDVFILTACDYDQYIDRITENVVYYKFDSWKSDWMLTLDDIMVVDILSLLSVMMHDFKISKTNLIRCYYNCHLNGMFPKLEFYDTEFGKFFRMFLPKSNSLINHGLLLNQHHYSNQEPKKFSCVLGPTFPTVRMMAYTQLMTNRSRSLKIAVEVKHDIIKSYQDKKNDDTPSKFQPQRVETKPQSFSF